MTRSVAVSVCMATYNGERFVREQVASILQQLGDDGELVVSDDGSKDRTLEIIEAFNDNRIHIHHRRSALRSPTANFENALHHSSGKNLFFADQDDWWAANKIVTMIGLLADYHVVNCDCSLVDSEGMTLAESFFALRKSRPGLLRNLLVNGYMGCCMAFRRELLELALPFPRGTPMHDMWVGLLGEARFRTHFLDVPLVMHRCHAQNASPTAAGSRNSPLRRARLRATLVFLLMRRLLTRHPSQS